MGLAGLQTAMHVVGKFYLPVPEILSTYEQTLEEIMLIICASAVAIVFAIGILACMMHRQISQETKYYDSITEAGIIFFACFPRMQKPTKKR
jgi:hypothetical protein